MTYQPLFWIHPDQPHQVNFDLVHECDSNFDNFVFEEGVTVTLHYDFVTMWEDLVYHAYYDQEYEDSMVREINSTDHKWPYNDEIPF